jgi:hypothetical protein
MAISLSGSLEITGSIFASGGITGSFSGTATSASYATNADLLDNRDSTTFANTGSNAFVGSQNINGNVAITGSLTTTGTIIAQTLNVQQVTSSIIYSSGSNVFGNLLSNTQSMTGSVGITGSLAVAGAATFSGGVTSRVNDGSAQFNAEPTTTTNSAYIQFLNSDGYGYIGKNSSAGGNLASGTLAYALVISTYKAGGTTAPIQFAPNNSIAATITSGGNVGIGTTSPQELLHLKSSLPFLEFEQTSTAGGSQKGIKFSDLNGQEHVQIVSNLENDGIGAAAASLVFKTATASTLTERMRITSGGDLQLASGVATFTRSGKKIELNANVSNLNVDAEIEVTSGMNLYYKLGGSERMRITSGGNVLINTTSDIGERLRLDGRIGIHGATVASGNTRSFFVRGAQNVADDATLSIGITNTSLVFIAENNTGTGALFFCGYASGTITKISDPSNMFDVADTDGKLCIFKSASSGDATVRNRLGSTKSITVSYIGVSD